MRQFMIFTLALMVTVPIFGQEPQTLISGDVDHGGYGGLTTRVTAIQGNPELLMGGRGAWIIDHTFYLGGGGIGVADGAENAPAGNLDFGYGGIMAGYIHSSDKLIHYTAGVMLAAGSAGIREPFVDEWEDEDQPAFYLVEPEANLEVNVAKHFRVTLGLSYRLVTNYEHDGITEEDLNGLATSLELKFGSF